VTDLTGGQSSCCWRFWAARAKGREAIPQNQIRSNNFVDGVFADTFYDLESGTNHTANRQQSPTEGRWLTPDPAGRVAQVRVRVLDANLGYISLPVGSDPCKVALCRTDSNAFSNPHNPTS